MNSQTKLILGAVAGAALGVLIVGLFGTKEGRRTRRDMKKKVRKMRNKTLQQVGELKVSAKRGYKAAKEAASNIIDEGKEKLSGLVGSTGTAGGAGEGK